MLARGMDIAVGVGEVVAHDEVIQGDFYARVLEQGERGGVVAGGRDMERGRLGTVRRARDR